MREQIRHQIELFERELATDLGRLPATDAWSSDDLHVLAHPLIAGAVVMTAESLIAALSEAENEIVERTRTQLRMVLVGALNWRSRT